MISIISGCSSYRVDTSNLSLLNNNELCNALGEKQSFDSEGFDRQKPIDRIRDEIDGRTAEGTLDKESFGIISEETKNHEILRVKFSSSIFNDVKIIKPLLIR